MAFRTNLYKFVKKRNSTARPADAGATAFDGVIKEDFSPLSFSMTFDLGATGNTKVPEYNYAYIADFKRYYYVTDWVFVSGMWRASLTVDVLATYKDQILASTQFIARAADSNYPGIIDTVYSTVGGSSMGTRDQTMTAQQFWGADFDTGTVVAGIINASGKNVGSITYYAFSAEGFTALMNKLLDGISWAGISTSEISEELQKALINPLQYIVSAIWLPVHDETFIGSWGAPAADVVSTINLGWWSFPLGGYYARILHNPLTVWDYFTRKVWFQIDKHPQYPALGNRRERRWLQLAPYSRYNLTFLPFGSFDIDTSELYGFSYLGVQARVHSYTGDATLVITAALDDQGTGEKVIQILNANCGVPLPLGQIALNIGNIDSALTSAAIMGATEIAKDITAPAVVSGSYDVKTNNKPSAHSATTRRR